MHLPTYFTTFLRNSGTWEDGWTFRDVQMAVCFPRSFEGELWKCSRHCIVLESDVEVRQNLTGYSGMLYRRVMEISSIRLGRKLEMEAELAWTPHGLTKTGLCHADLFFVLTR